MIAVDLEKVLLAACQGCNEEFSEEPCEPGSCMIRAKLEKLPRVTLGDLRPKGRWIDTEDGETVCSNCNTRIPEMYSNADTVLPSECCFCHRCGVKMAGGDTR